MGVLPLAAAAFLGRIIVKSAADFTQGETLTLLVMLFIAESKGSPYFRLPRAKYGDD